MLSSPPLCTQVDQFKVDSPNVQYGPDAITSQYTYQHVEVERSDAGSWTLKPKDTKFEFRTDTRVPKLG